MRSEIRIDLGAVRRNVHTLRRAAPSSELWAVVKANGYGHGAGDVAGAVLDEGATMLCVATVPEALELRTGFPAARILVFGPAGNREIADARDADLELAVSVPDIPLGVKVHLKIDTGMGRWGVSELVQPASGVVGLMSHLATADSDRDFTETQIERFRVVTEPYKDLTRHLANSAGTLRFPASHFDAVRPGLAIYGLSPFERDPGEDGLEPALTWTSELALVRKLRPGESTGYGRRFVAEADTWIGIVPVGYADGFPRNLTGTEVRVGGEPRPVVGTVSMDAFAVELDRQLPVGTPVVIVGQGVFVHDHARVARTISHDFAAGINSDPRRARHIVVG